ncbi:TetR family transcriptional regulator, partial [Nocardia sp. NPDC057030]
AVLFEERREFARQRRAVIIANTGLQERELIKMASLAAAMADALRERGVGDTTASLTAEVGIAAFKVAFERWIDAADPESFAQIIRESLDELAVIVRPAQDS